MQRSKGAEKALSMKKEVKDACSVIFVKIYYILNERRKVT